MKTTVSKVVGAVVAALVSPSARRYETALALVIYQAVRTVLGHP